MNGWNGMLSMDGVFDSCAEERRYILRGYKKWRLEADNFAIVGYNWICSSVGSFEKVYGCNLVVNNGERD